MEGRKSFEPADGLSPRWKKLYDLVMTKSVGDEVTYREAIEILGFDRKTDKTLHIAQSAMRGAVAHLERDGQRTVGTVANFGWIVLNAQRELSQVDRRLAKTRRAAGRTLRGSIALNGRREELSQFERERLDHINRTSNLLMQMTGRKRVDFDDLRRQIER